VKRFLFFLSLIIFSIVIITAQETDLFDWDIDFIFEQNLSDIVVFEDENNTQSVLASIRRRGISFDFSYQFQGGVAPGWSESPWFFDGNEIFTWKPGIRMKSSVTIDAQISEVFRVLSVINTTVPDSNLFSLGDFFFDYNVLNTVFIRAGKYEHSWGISPNFGFANLLSRIPEGDPGGDSYVFKADIPIGIGGFQAVALTRIDSMNDMPDLSDIGFGCKYNLALRFVDFDLGIFYMENMATRGFLSIKTTLFETEIYNEWLAAVNTHSNNEFSFAANIGFLKELFNRKILINGEVFFNGEGNTYWYRKETEIKDAEPSLFMDGFNIALNLLYRHGGRGNPRFFVHMLYAPIQETMQLVPGFRLTPLQHIDFYMAVPMALGNQTGYYYTNTADPFNRPFSVVMLISLKGNLQTSFN